MLLDLDFAFVDRTRWEEGRNRTLGLWVLLARETRLQGTDLLRHLGQTDVGLLAMLRDRILDLEVDRIAHPTVLSPMRQHADRVLVRLRYRIDLLDDVDRDVHRGDVRSLAPREPHRVDVRAMRPAVPRQDLDDPRPCLALIHEVLLRVQHDYPG